MHVHEVVGLLGEHSSITLHEEGVVLVDEGPGKVAGHDEGLGTAQGRRGSEGEAICSSQGSESASSSGHITLISVSPRIGQRHNDEQDNQNKQRAAQNLHLRTPTSARAHLWNQKWVKGEKQKTTQQPSLGRKTQSAFTQAV